MKKKLILGAFIASVAILLTACGGSARLTKSTSTRVDLANSVRIIPTLATLNVNPARVSATMTAAELASLNAEEQKQAVVAKALASVNGDVLLAPQFAPTKDAEGKLATLSVTGYAATVYGFRPMNESDVVFDEELLAKSSQAKPEKMAANTMTVAEIEFTGKKSYTMSVAEMAGKKEADALKLAKEKLLRQEKMDVLYGAQYTVTIDNGAVTAFTLTAFPGRYANYRKTSMREILALKPSKDPRIEYQTIAADITPVAGRVQHRYGSSDPTAKMADLKETARQAVLKKYNADFLLNETFYFDYQEKAITHVTICGTPAVYSNFRPLREGELADVKLAPFKGAAAEQEQPKSILDMILGLFKKK